jgi:hypothetical protein
MERLRVTWAQLSAGVKAGYMVKAMLLFNRKAIARRSEPMLREGGAHAQAIFRAEPSD